MSNSGPPLPLSSRPVGLVGVGLLGTALAERLLSGGYQVVGYDTNRQRLEQLVSLEGRAASSAALVLQQCSQVVLCLPTSRISFEVLATNRAAIQASQLIVDTTTGSPSEMVRCGQLVEDQSASYLEATVAGSSVQARAGKAALFLGGESACVQRHQGLLDALAERHFHLGPVGAASRFKLVHNLLLGLHRAVLAEGLAFAESIGFEPGKALDVLRLTPAASAVMDTKGPKMLAADWAPQARLSQHLKDVRLILAEAESCGALTPLSRLHRQLLEEAERLGLGESDNSAIYEVFRQRSES